MSDNLSLTQLAASQAQKEVTINATNGELDAALTEFVTADFTSGNVTISNANYRRAILLRATTVTVAGRVMTLPAIKRLISIHSVTGNTQPLTIRRGTTDLELLAGRTGLFYTDGTTNGLVRIGDGGDLPYDIGVFTPGLPVAGAVLFRLPAVRAFFLPANLSGSRALSVSAATATAEFSIRKNGTEFATFSFAAAATTATFTGPGSITEFTTSDNLSVVAPNPQDATLADVGLLLRGGR